jgi:8-hydroxy-5-deazaflavin:NADPH oxidoreductase
MSEVIGFIGTGMIGSALARLSVAAGYSVVISNSRGPDSLADFVKELGPLARAATREEAAASADLVIASVPMGAYTSLPVNEMKGKVVIDTMNYYPAARDGGIDALDKAEITSSEMIQQHLRDAVVVKALHNLDFHHLYANARPAGHKERTTLPVAGDDMAAVEKVIRFMDKLGYNAVHIGSLEKSWKIEPGTPLYVWPYVPEIPAGLSKEEQRKVYIEQPGKPLTAADVKAIVDKTERGEVIGGSPDDLPALHVELVGEVYASRK